MTRTRGCKDDVVVEDESEIVAIISRGDQPSAGFEVESEGWFIGDLRKMKHVYIC